MSEDDSNEGLNSKIVVLLIGVGSAALVVTIYHCLAMSWCGRRHRSAPNQQRYVTQATPNNIEKSTTQLIPAYKYQKGISLMVDDGTCAICLSEFEEGEELRTLPECLHSYHVACIDMWLYSHSNCPMCRTHATPSPQVFSTAIDLGPERSPELLRNVGMLHGIVNSGAI